MTWAAPQTDAQAVYWKCRSNPSRLWPSLVPWITLCATRFPVSTVPRFADALRRLQAARLAEVEALGELVSALAGTTSGAFAGTSDSPADSELCYLSVLQLAARIPYAPQTIRNLMSSGELLEGEHYFKRRGRVMFSWPAMRAWVEQQGVDAEHDDALPLVRNRRNGPPSANPLRRGSGDREASDG